MSFFQRRPKVVVPTPNPPVTPVRRFPNNGLVKASVLVIPPNGSVRQTGILKYGEFDVESDSALRMVLRQYRILGVVQVAECNSSAIIIADIVCVPMKYVGEQVEPETWYLPSSHTWQYPLVHQHRAHLITRSKVGVQHHSTMQSDDDFKPLTSSKRELLEGDRVFLVVHCLIQVDVQLFMQSKI